MDKETYWQIRNGLKEAGIWAQMQNTVPYTVDQLLEAFGSQIPEPLQELLKAKVARVQAYFDDRIIEPLEA